MSTIPVKAVIDDHIQRLFDALLNSLRRGINNDVNKIDNFLENATDTLSKRPQTVEEIGEANAKHTEFTNSKKEVCLECKQILLSDSQQYFLHICYSLQIL